MIKGINKKINKYSFINGEEIIETDNGKFFVKKKNDDTKELYNYLSSRKFNNYLKLEEDNKDVEIYSYKDDNVKTSDKAIDLVYLLSMLHIKTTTYREVNLDEVKRIYENVNDEINALNIYYHKLQDEIETKVYMSPAEYLLIRNISIIYKMLVLSKESIDKWYSIKIKQNRERVVLVHNNVSINNFIDTDKLIFKNWDKALKDYVVYDFYSFYKNDYKNLEFNSLFDLYQRKYKYSEDEMLLFNSLINKVWIVNMDSSNYDNTVKVNDLITYIKKTNKFLLKNNHEEQKTNKNEFYKENDNIQSSSNK